MEAIIYINIWVASKWKHTICYYKRLHAQDWLSKYVNPCLLHDVTTSALISTVWQGLEMLGKINKWSFFYSPEFITFINCVLLFKLFKCNTSAYWIVNNKCSLMQFALLTNPSLQIVQSPKQGLKAWNWSTRLTLSAWSKPYEGCFRAKPYFACSSASVWILLLFPQLLTDPV